MHEILNEALVFITGVNFLASIVLCLIVFQHYLFFKRGAPSKLKKRIGLVFLSDLLMGLSVSSYSITQYFMTPEEYFENIELKVALKMLQFASVAFACWANIGLYRHIKDE